MTRSVRQSVTAADIARRVGVSQTTVSLVMRGKARQNRISVKTRQRVLAAMKELNYVPNLLARGLRSGRTGAVGVIFGNFKAD